MADVDQVLLAVSDVMVRNALERAWARTVKRSGRLCPPEERHTQYLTANPIPEAKFQATLHDAWVLCPLMAGEYGLQVPPADWAAILDGYTKALLMTQQPHEVKALAAVLMYLPDQAMTAPTADG